MSVTPFNVTLSPLNVKTSQEVMTVNAKRALRQILDVGQLLILDYLMVGFPMTQ